MLQEGDIVRNVFIICMHTVVEDRARRIVWDALMYGIYYELVNLESGRVNRLLCQVGGLKVILLITVSTL